MASPSIGKRDWQSIELGDHTQFYNYLSNAIKFTPNGGHVTVRGLAEGDQHFRLEIEDNGMGISVADQARLFTEFQQLDTSYTKQHQGTGLGLALTRRLVEAQGGQVGVRSQPGVGSVFHLILPRVQRDPAALDGGAMAALTVPGSPAATTSTPPAAAADQGLLVIEGDISNQSPMVGALKRAGYPVDTEANAQQAVQQALGKTYSGITLDLLLAGQPGLSVLADIRSQGLSSQSPVIGLTISDPTGQASPSARFSISNILSKPIEVDEVASAMAQFRTVVSRPGRVLVIDDNPRALELMRTTLENLGIETSCVLDGRDALRDLDQHRPRRHHSGFDDA